MDLKEILHSEYTKLSKSQQKVAKYLLEKPRDFAMMSANEIGTQVGVSETTVIRFCYAIHLSGFSELQKTVREQLLFQKSSLGQYYSSKLELADRPHFYAEVMERDRQQIQETINQINETDFNHTIDQLLKADEIYIAGLRTSFSAANWLAFTLGLVRENVKLVRSDSDDILYTLSGMGSQSVLIAISFHRYLKETVKITELAKKQGATVIGITDSSLSPIRDFSDILFPLYPSEMSTIDTAPALFSFLNAVVAGVTVKNPVKFEKRKEQYEELFRNYFIGEGGEAN